MHTEKCFSPTVSFMSFKTPSSTSGASVLKTLKAISWSRGNGSAQDKYGAQPPPRKPLGPGGAGKDTHPAVDDDHMLGVTVQPGLLRLADGAHLVQGWRVQLGPAHVQNLQRQSSLSSRLWALGGHVHAVCFTSVFHSRAQNQPCAAFQTLSGDYDQERKSEGLSCPMRHRFLGLICSSKLE